MVLHAENLDPLAALHDGRDHTKPSPSQMLVGDDMARRQTATDVFWNDETRQMLGIRESVRLSIPLTNKHDLKKYADLLRGMASRMEYLSADVNSTELAACIGMQHLTSEIQMKMDLTAGRKRKTRR